MIIPQLLELYRSCTLCPRACRVDRTKGELGYCRLPSDIVMDCALSHHGEEPPLSGTGGAGTIFLASCNLGCVYCQNYQISHSAKGRLLTVIELARIMIDLQKSGCHNVEPVTPTPQTPLIMEALCLARAQGLTVPLVYNCGGYENPDVIHLLDGMVDIYLPDFKYGLEEDARMFSDAPDYSKFAVASLQEMVRQVGDDLDVENGIASRGVIIRHLVLPGRLENSKEALRLLRGEVSARIPISLMSQYTPVPKVRSHPLLGRRVTASEYHEIVEFALRLGFENLFIQEVDDRALTPDFNREHPFN
ncbi:MAG: radical SAM protein [Smithellaceae bacterium]|jgi:putative pyruvate formate lyase activating enzyme|nr:radical SAM protein [Smithellaceae bacterium]MDD3259852.1 radical SAM protein [Smithellaceae bacterium]MDD3849626.1 radical SAM protein [Smithellaceae bacterium]